VSLHDHVHGRQNASRGLLWDGQNRLGVCHATCFMDDEVGDATYGQVMVMGQPEFIMHRYILHAVLITSYHPVI